MSDFAKPDMQSDTQDTFFEENESDSQFIKNSEDTSACLAESQDFHLLDTGDSQEFEADLSKAPTNEAIAIESVKEDALAEKTIVNESKEDILENKDQSMEEQDEDDEDVVHGTPPHCLSSPSKKLTSVTDLKSLKRMADSDISIENALTIKRSKIESPQDVLQEELEAMEADTLPLENKNQDSQKQVDDLEKCLIIPETQYSMQDTQPIDIEDTKDLKETEDIMEAEKNSESGKNMDLTNDNSLEEECDLVNETLNSVDEGNVNQNDSTAANFAENDLSNQNKVSVNEEDLNESKNVSEEIDFSEDVSFTEKGDDKEDSKESENFAEKETSKDVEKITEITDSIGNQTETKFDEPEAQEVSKRIIDEVEKTKSIEDTLKQLGEEPVTIESTEKLLAEKESTESELLAALTDSDTNAEVDEGSEKKEVKMEKEDLLKTKVEEKSDTISKSRMSIEVIYDRSSLSQEIKAKPAEVVEIDEDGEKIILDSSQEDSNVRSVLPPNSKEETIYKSCYVKSNSDFSYKSVVSSKDSKDYLEDPKIESLLTNGDNSKKMELDTTSSIKSNESLDNDPMDKIAKDSLNTKSESVVANPPFFVISDSEGDSMLENKSTTEINAIVSTAKTLQVEKEINVCVRLKCLVTIDENTKEILSKELLGINCETVADQRNSDISASLADISGNDNKDSSPGSVTSTTYPRFSIMSTSTLSSTTSSSSSGSLPPKVSSRDKMFSVPKGPAKHTKKLPYDEKNSLELDQLSKEWKNPHLVTISVLNFVNAELSGVDLQNGVADSLDEPLRKIHSSTPEANKETPQRSTKKGRPPKRLQTRASRKRTKVMATKTSPNVIDPIQEDSDDQSSSTLKETKSKSVTPGSSTPVKKPLEGLRNVAPLLEQGDDLLGKEVFAKWSDNNYYAGMVVDKIKAKYKVNFHDGKSKQLIPEFVVPIPRTLNKGLSVYTLTKDGDYGPCGIIVDVLEVNGKVSYVIEPDEGKRITVQIKDIFLTPDQAQVLKEEVSTESNSLPSTPHSISKVSLENMIDGKRRSRRNASTTHTPKSKKSLTSIINRTLENEPSISGVALKSKEAPVSDKDGKTSDSNCSVIEESGIHGVQKEIIGTTNEQVTTKGPQSRIKGKQRNRKKPDDQETIDLLGPIPEPNSKIFEGMSFLLTCASVEGIDRYHVDNGGDSYSETGTENEEEWQSRPFVRDRLEQQLIAGGGKVYDNFDLIPVSEYENTKLITNVPNLTAKSLLCLSVGISAYNHMWVIRSCKDNKAVNPSEEKLPAGWSIDKRSYVEMFHRRDQKPLTHIIVVIPCKEESDKEFVSFWSRICENAGGTVRVVDNPEISFIEGTVVLTNHRCPTWVIEKAKGWEIPLVSTTWLVQSLIEGKILTYDGHKRFKLF